MIPLSGEMLNIINQIQMFWPLFLSSLSETSFQQNLEEEISGCINSSCWRQTHENFCRQSMHLHKETHGRKDV